MKKQKIIIAVPRGRITEDCKDLLNRTNFAPDPKLFCETTRKLTFNSQDKNIDPSILSYPIKILLQLGANLHIGKDYLKIEPSSNVI